MRAYILILEMFYMWSGCDDVNVNVDSVCCAEARFERYILIGSV